jgi:hypothetical protein
MKQYRKLIHFQRSELLTVLAQAGENRVIFGSKNAVKNNFIFCGIFYHRK